MDEQRLDTLTRSIAQGASRRAVLRLLFGGAAAVVARQALPVSATSEKIAMCKPHPSGYKLVEINAKLYDKRLAGGYIDPPYYCDNGPSCEACQSTCAEMGEQCAGDADCCSTNCLSSGVCGDLCSTLDRYDPIEQAELGPLRGASTGTLCMGGPGCLTSADCTVADYTVCVVAPDLGPDGPCVTSGGACAYSRCPARNRTHGAGSTHRPEGIQEGPRSERSGPSVCRLGSVGARAFAPAAPVTLATFLHHEPGEDHGIGCGLPSPILLRTAARYCRRSSATPTPAPTADRWSIPVVARQYRRGSRMPRP